MKKGITKKENKLFNLGMKQGERCLINTFLKEGFIKDEKKDDLIFFIIAKMTY